MTLKISAVAANCSRTRDSALLWMNDRLRVEKMKKMTRIPMKGEKKKSSKPLPFTSLGPCVFPPFSSVRPSSLGNPGCPEGNRSLPRTAGAGR